MSQWREIDGKYYYFGTDGYMLADTVTPDDYQVGADGAWVLDAGTNTRMVAPYMGMLSGPLFYGASPDYLGEDDIFYIDGYQTALTDCGSYYELQGQELWDYKVYATEKAAKESSFYCKGFQPTNVEKRPDGGWVVCDGLSDYETVTVYTGPIYIDKNVLVAYVDYMDQTMSRSRICTCTLAEYFARSGAIEGTQPGHIRGCVQQIDLNGYVMKIRILQAG